MSDTKPAISPVVQRMLDAQRRAGWASKQFIAFDLGDRVRQDAWAIQAAQPSDIEIADILHDERQERHAR